MDEDPKAQGRLAISRGIPRSAFQGWGMGFDGTYYTIPVKNPNGTVSDVRRYRLGHRTQATSSAVTGLMGAEHIAKHEDVYVCEGEWDAIALSWLLRKLKVKGAVVAVPGASTFKKEWIPWFKGKRVYLLYDNDGPGERGCNLCRERLEEVAASIQYITWPSGAPDGFDVRDWIVLDAVKDKQPRKCWRDLQKLFVEGSAKGSEEEAELTISPIPRQELIKTFKRWMHIKDEAILAVLFGSVIANRLEGDPLWLFIVAPPGGMKSELLMSIAKAKLIYSCSSLTPHALVSGAATMGNGDPSLLPQLDGKILVIKDFTTTLTMHPTARDEIFGQLRDAYDGRFEKAYGNGQVRRYDSHFGVIAGVTPNIDAYSSLNQGLGERFLKYRLEKHAEPEDERERIVRAMSNVNKEVNMRKELQSAGSAFLHNDFTDIPELDDKSEERIVALAMLIARLRGVVNRDKYDHQQMLTRASYELGTRLAKQLVKLAFGIGMFYGESVVSLKTMKIVCNVAIHTVLDKVSAVVRALWGDGEFKPRRIEDMVEMAGLTRATIRRTLEDFEMLKLVERKKVTNTEHGSHAYTYMLKQKVWNLLKETQVFND